MTNGEERYRFSQGHYCVYQIVMKDEDGDEDEVEE